MSEGDQKHVGQINEELWPKLDNAFEAIGDKNTRSAIIDYLEANSLTFIACAPPPEVHRYYEKDVLNSKKFYVIKDSEFTLFKEVSKQLATAVGMFYTGLHHLLPAIGIQGIATLWLELAKYHKKRIQITDEQAFPLITLSKHGSEGLELKELSEVTSISTEKLESILASLQQVRSKDGTKQELVEEKDGRWYAIDV